MTTPARSSPALIRLDRVEKRYADGLLAVQDLSLEIDDNEFVAILGPSGCGKSTVLRMVAGLDEAPTAGRIEAPELRAAQDAPVAFVFQEPTLMPWATVFDNVWLPMRLAGQSRIQCASRVRAALQGMGLAEFEQAYPAQLSGGMKMRASIARALVTEPRALLMDEPFAALDEITRSRLNADLLEWWRAQRMAVLFVTHNIYEAVFLAQRVLVMSARPGRILSELRIDAPYPREAGFRATEVFHRACRELSAALQAAG